MAIDHFKVGKFSTITYSIQIHIQDILEKMRKETDEEKRIALQRKYDELVKISPSKYAEWLVKNGGDR